MLIDRSPEVRYVVNQRVIELEGARGHIGVDVDEGDCLIGFDEVWRHGRGSGEALDQEDIHHLQMSLRLNSNTESVSI
jgi:hypothetical protein